MIAARTCSGVAVPVTPICRMVIDATRLPNAAASNNVAPAATAHAMAALVLSPAPTGSIGPGTRYPVTCRTLGGSATSMP